MLPTPVVSVIIPTYNRAKTIERAINSVLNQTFSELELIVVDDCSTDSTAEIIKKYRDDRLIYIKHDKNRGEGGARNTGIRNSRAKYIAFLDSDDEWFPNKLVKQIRVIQESDPKVGVVYSHYIMQYEDGSGVNPQRPSMRGDILLGLLTGTCFLPSSAIIKSECFCKYLHDENLPNLQDLDLWISIAHDYYFDYVAEVLCTIYQGTPAQASKNILTRLKGLELFLDKWGDLIEKKLGNGQIKRIRDATVSSLYATITESMNAGNRVGAFRQFFHIAFRSNSFYRGPFERKTILYNILLLVVGVKVHRMLVRFIKKTRTTPIFIKL